MPCLLDRGHIKFSNDKPCIVKKTKLFVDGEKLVLKVRNNVVVKK